MVRSPAASGPHSSGDLVDSYRRLADESAPGGLLSAGGAFAHFPGAVLFAGHNGIVLNANAMAQHIGQFLQSGQHADLRTPSPPAPPTNPPHAQQNGQPAGRARA